MSLTSLTTTASPRHLVLRALAQSQPNQPGNAAKGRFKSLGVGEQQPFSFFRPSLEGGDYIISTMQSISHLKESLPDKTDRQDFTVITPRFKLPDDAIKSMYPPVGFGAPVETLPHLAFNDPYLPWERHVSDLVPTSNVYRVPWLALLMFTADELLLPPEHLKGDKSILRNIKHEPPVMQEQDAGMAISIPLECIKDLADCQTPITPGSASDAEAASASTIFVKPSLFTELFRDNNNPESSQQRPDLSRYGYLSHIRRVNTTGMADADVDGEAFYSLIVSHRVGPLDQKDPSPVLVHLVSLEGVENLTLPLDTGTQYVAMASLHSWSYNCLPPNAFDVESVMEHLGLTSAWLRATPPDPVSDPECGEDNKHIIDRINDGYTLTRYRVQTGETTAAIFRGALTPKFVPHPLSESWNMLSDCGMDLQILDEKLGLPDITYYAAWQLGKTTAIADRAFSTALTKLRATIHVMAMGQAKARIMRKKGVFLDRQDALASTSQIVETLAKIQNDEMPGNRPEDLASRWVTSKQKPVDLSLGNKTIEAEYARSSLKVAEELAKSADGDEETIYNELNKPSNTEWAQVLAWLLDKMYLSNIPSQYLVVDPNHLPPESLRFFHIDANWIDAFIDGALSIGNHLESRFDKVRASIKRLVNRYIATPFPSGQLPLVPCFGFFMRSEIVSRFPDLRVAAEFSPSRANTTMPSILRQVIVSDGVLLCLLDVSPFSNASSRLTKLTFTQPPHQQSFAAGQSLSANQLKTIYRRIYTSYDGSSRSQSLCEPDEDILSRSISTDMTDPPVFKWGPNNTVRTLQFPAWSDRQLKLLQDHMPKDESVTFDGTTANSAIVGIQLTTPINQFTIAAGDDVQPVELPSFSRPRTFWVPDIPDYNEDALEDDKDDDGGEPPLLPILAPLDPPGARDRMTVLPPTTIELLEQAGMQRHTPEIAKFATTALQQDALIGPTNGPAGMPTYRLQIFPAGRAADLDANQSSIPMGPRQDLIFSISLSNPDLEGDFPIDEIRVLVPMGLPAGSGKPAYMFRHYHGPGPSMLSNLRFNVLASVDENATNIMFRLVPRTSGPGGLPFHLAKEISFILSLADVNVFPAHMKQRKAQVTLIQRFWKKGNVRWDDVLQSHNVILKQ
ncbi:hypothetical protein SLS60_011018 [Paraconiothyrium brasiliense]|uniref:Uncharacterized protein n=1 Tax=Paraconiothyrium brasiliense TaxID=300254 RepID=A0ABR3QL87_9PLEO